ncbi:MAG: histidine phosphatase family protein [Candidatus Binatia bacterium]|nr:histidine phosphatase family protein [Candidatus Binatia bacterium]
MAREILIIRHGETASNAARIVQTPETPLSERGSDQARRLAERLAAGGVERILTSDLLRALMTAEAVRATTQALLEVNSLLQERNFGDVRGTPYSELGDRNIFAYEFAPPGGETGAVFDARVDEAWDAIRTCAAGVEARLAVVTHGLVCAALTARHFELGGLVAPEGWANTSVTAVEGVAPWRVLRLDCTEHLDKTSRDGGAV